MGIVRVSTTVLVVLAFLSGGLLAGGLGEPGVGTKAIAMGGAFRAIADDWTAAYYNPAGYADLYDNQYGANLALVHFRNEIVPDYRWGGQYETGIINDIPNYNRHDVLFNPSAGILIRVPMWGETVIGFSAYQPYDYNVHWSLYSTDPTSAYSLLTYNTDGSLPGNQYQNNLDVVSFQATAAREFIEEKLLLGVGLQLLRGDLHHTSVVFRDNPYLQRDPGWEGAHFPYNKITQWVSNDGYGWGVGFKAGMIWKHSEKATFAATASFPMNVAVSGASSLEFYLPDIDIGRDADDWDVQFLLTSGQKLVDSADFDVDLKLPPTIAVGLAYEVNEKTTLTFDAEYSFWSCFDGFSFEYSGHRGLRAEADTISYLRDFFTADIVYPVDWSNSGKVMAGASYDYADYVTLLGGLSVDQSPARKHDRFTPLLVDLGTKVGLSAGLVAHIEQWDLGLTTSYVHHPDGETSTLEDINGDGTYDSFVGSYKAATYQTVLSFNYRF